MTVDGARAGRGPRRLALSLALALVGTFGVAVQVSASGPCGDGGVEWRTADGPTRCIHVDDRSDLATGTEQALAALDADGPVTVAASPWSTAVAGDDVDLVCDRSSNRHRVQVLYAHTGSNDLSTRRAEIERTVAIAQSQYDLSSETHGAANAWIPRFVTTSSGPDGCRLVVTAVQVTSAAVQSSNPAVLFQQLVDKGYDDTDRSYLVMVDVASTPYCGLGSSYYDDSANPRFNTNNNRPQPAFSRADRTPAGFGQTCWDIAVAHELGHNLGAVQPSAPNATRGFHCVDGLDTMCYDDFTPEGDDYRTTVCTDDDAAFVLDCNADDYFSPSPSPGSYLATRWNIRDSDWLLATNLRSWSRGGTVGASGTVFDDVSYGDTFAMNITQFAEAGVTKGCNPPANTRYCPDDPVLRQQMAVFLDRVVDLPTGSRNFVDVPTSSPYRYAIQGLAAEGITQGCNPPANTRFCPTAPVTRAQMAVFLTKALDLPPGSGGFVDVPSSSPYRSAIQALAAADITRGCNPPANDRFCPNAPVTRAQMAAFLLRTGEVD